MTDVVLGYVNASVLAAWEVFDTDYEGMSVSSRGIYLSKSEAELIKCASPYRSTSEIYVICLREHSNTAPQYYKLAEYGSVDVNVDFVKEREDLKRAGLAKLTSKERAALGLK